MSWRGAGGANGMGLASRFLLLYFLFGNILSEFAGALIAGDTCSTALPVTIGQQIHLDTTSATEDAPASFLTGACFSGTIAGIWLKVTAPSSRGTLTILTSPSTSGGSVGDTVLYVLSGASCSTLTCRAANDNNGGSNYAALSLSVSAGESFYVLVGGYFIFTGAFEFNTQFSLAGDTCGTAVDLPVPAALTVDTTLATSDNYTSLGSNCDFTSGLLLGVWLKITASVAGAITISTSVGTSNIIPRGDTVLRVLSGTSCSTRLCRASNDDISTTNMFSSVTVSAAAGEVLYVLVGAYGGAVGTFVVNTQTAIGDTCDKAIALPGATTSLTVDTTSATADTVALTGGPGCSVNTGTLNGVWLRIFPVVAGSLTISTSAAASNPISGGDTVVRVLSGTSCSALTCRAASDNISSTNLFSSVTLTVAEGEVLYILVGGSAAKKGAFVVNALFTPVGDTCGAAVAISVPGTATMDTTYAGTDSLFGAPGCFLGSGTNYGVWLKVTNTNASPSVLSITTSVAATAPNRLSSGDIVLRAVRGTCASYICVAENWSPSLLVYQQAGETSYILAGGLDGAKGAFVVSTSYTLPTAGDTCDVARAITLDTPIDIDLTLTTVDDFNALGQGCGFSLNAVNEVGTQLGAWLKLTPPGPGTVFVSTTTTVNPPNYVSGGTLLIAANGTCGNLTCRAANTFDIFFDFFFVSITFSVSASESIYILAGRHGNFAGPFSVTATFTPAPPTPTPAPSRLPTASPTPVATFDDCAGAVPLVVGAASTAVDTTSAVSDESLTFPCLAAFGAAYGVWFSITVSAATPVTVYTLAGSIDTVLMLSTGTACGSLSCGQYSDDYPNMGIFSRIDIAAVPGQTYYVVAAGFQGARGSIQIAAASASPPSNDFCSGAQSLTINAAPVSGSIVNVLQFDDVLWQRLNCVIPAGQFSNPGPAYGAWYSVDVASAGTLRVVLTGFDSVVYVSSGSACDSLSCIAYADEPTACTSGCTFGPAAVSFSAAPGKYWILVTGFAGNRGTYTIAVNTVTPAPSPAPTSEPTLAPVTLEPTTSAPVTSKPTLAPVTYEPTTSAPVTSEPTLAPVTSEPTTSAPVTIKPTLAPVTYEPTTSAPVTSEPTLAPVTLEPTTSAPVTSKPTLAPVTSEPTTSAPVTIEPTPSPVTNEPTTAAPVSEVPVTAAPTKKGTAKPTTAKPTKSPTTAKPTKTPTTAKPTKTPTTAKPTKTPTTAKPTKAPTPPPATPRPTTALEAAVDAACACMGATNGHTHDGYMACVGNKLTALGITGTEYDDYITLYDTTRALCALL